MKKIICVAVTIACLAGCRKEGQPDNVNMIEQSRLVSLYQGNVGGASLYVIRDKATGSEFLLAYDFHGVALASIAKELK